MGNITIYCQPAYNYGTQNIEYAEILVREYNDKNGVYNIMNSIKASNSEAKFDLDILNETLDILNEYGKLGMPVGVNLCPVTMEQAGVAEKIVDILKTKNKYNNEIVIEINESTDFRHKNVLANARYFNEHHIKIALDDFGIDSANLLVLIMYKIDILKVDKKFVDLNNEQELEESQASILRALSKIIEDLQIKHVVEGIETEKQLNEIKSLGYKVVQGYVYEKPVQFTKFIEENMNKNTD